MIEAKYYAEVSFEWYDRRDENDGSFQGSIPYGDVYHSEGVAWSALYHDAVEGFKDKMNSNTGSIADGTINSWFDYDQMKPSRDGYSDPYEDFYGWDPTKWAGCQCDGLVYNSAIQAGYKSYNVTYNNPDWYGDDANTDPVSKGFEQEGDIVCYWVLNTIAHVGVVISVDPGSFGRFGQGFYDQVVSSNGIYASECATCLFISHKATIHTIGQYDSILNGPDPSWNFEFRRLKN